MQDRNVKDEDKIIFALGLFYKEIPKDIQKAIKGILWFYSMGESENPKKQAKENSKRNNIYSYEYDAKYFYSAFWHDYRLDLNEIDYLHWWKFKSLFEGLNEENMLCKIMGYRAVDLSKIKDDKEKKKYKKLKQQWALPDERTEEEKENDFAEAFW